MATPPSVPSVSSVPPRHSERALRATLDRIDGRGYRAYKDIEGDYAMHDWRLAIDHVQGDPFAAPSRLRALVPAATAGFDMAVLATASRRVGLAACLARSFASAAEERSRRRGSGRSGAIRIEAPGQAVYPQTAVIVGADGAVEARFTVGLPAAGRTVLGRQAAELLCEDLPVIVAESLRAAAHDPALLWRHAATNEDADALRAALDGLGLVAFVAEGAILPRRSGVDERPLAEGAIPMHAPDALRVAIDLPHAGTVAGLGIPRGVTLITGGGFHGKSTLLRAIAHGVWNHRPGDGRERAVAVGSAVKIRAEDGRSVAGVDISAFIGDLPQGQSTTAFSTQSASGSTSQAAAIVEALEAGATCLLIDEDTSATNFMLRDRRMQALVARADEPITPFIDRVRELVAAHGVSTVLVIGGSGDYLDVADTVIGMTAYRPVDLTAAARQVAADYPTGRQSEVIRALGHPAPRVPLPRSIELRERYGRSEVGVKVRGRDLLQLGEEDLDLAAVEQIVATPQTRAIGLALAYAREQGLIDGRRSVAEILDAVLAAIDTGGPDALDHRRVGDLAAFRRHDLAAALNRLRGLQVR